MVDVLRKHVAPAHRILVDAKAFLNTEFDDAVLFFTGGQIELMRNLVDYANRRTTFVSDYYIGYYLSPTDADWNLIQASVADLEGTLMGNPNTIWGYHDTYLEEIVEPDMPAGNSNIDGATVPEGEVWRITGYSAQIISATCTGWWLVVDSSPDDCIVDAMYGPATGIVYPEKLDVVLKEGDHLYGRFYTMTLNDDAYLYLWGYKMKVAVP